MTLAVAVTAAQAAQKADREGSAASGSLPASATEADKKAHEYIILHHGSYNPQAQAKAADAAALGERLKEIRPLNHNDTSQPGSRTATGNIYRCRKGDSEVYADDKNHYRFRDCRLIRRARPEAAAKPAQSDPAKPPNDTAHAQNRSPDPKAPSCSGTILYRGSTYIFNDSEPCPIPQAVFRARKPIEAEPSYYTQ